MPRLKHLGCAAYLLLALFGFLTSCENVPSRPEAVGFDTLKAAGAAIDSYRRDVEFAKAQGQVTDEEWLRFANRYNEINDKIIAAAKVIRIVVVAGGEDYQPSTPEIDALVRDLFDLVKEILPPPNRS